MGGGEGNGPFPGKVSLKRNALDVAKSHGDPEDLENQAIELLLRHASWCAADMRKAGLPLRRGIRSIACAVSPEATRIKPVHYQDVRNVGLKLRI